MNTNLSALSISAAAMFAPCSKQDAGNRSGDWLLARFGLLVDEAALFCFGL